jgi:hypothetical protein
MVFPVSSYPPVHHRQFSKLDFITSSAAYTCSYVSQTSSGFCIRYSDNLMDDYSGNASQFYLMRIFLFSFDFLFCKLPIFKPIFLI